MIITGKVHLFRDDVNTDEIIPARYLNTSDEAELARHCMEDIDADFPQKVKPGDIMVAGRNFGCGSSREHAPIAIKAAKVSCVLAKSFARIFYRNCFNIGLPIFESAAAVEAIKNGDTITIDTEKGTIAVASGAVHTIPPIPVFMQELISTGGLIEYVKKKYVSVKK